MGEDEVPTDAPVIEFRNVSMSFDARRVLSDVSFRLRRGQMIIITGAGGSGKSVLLHLAIGLLQAETGEVLIEGRAIEPLTETELLQIRSARMGMVFQEDTLFTGMDVYDNAAYRLTEHGWPEEEVDAAVRQILRFVGLESDVDKLPEELSIGMRRRLEIARALVGWPPIMLFDEPTAGLDPINARQVLDLIIRARDIHGISSLYVTKELHEIPYLATHYAESGDTEQMPVHKGAAPLGCELRVLVLDGGKIVFFGTPDEFASSTVPAVTLLTHPEAAMHASHAYVQDHRDKGRGAVKGLP